MEAGLNRLVSWGLTWRSGGENVRLELASVNSRGHCDDQGVCQCTIYLTSSQNRISHLYSAFDNFLICRLETDLVFILRVCVSHRFGINIAHLYGVLSSRPQSHQVGSTILLCNESMKWSGFLVPKVDEFIKTQSFTHCKKIALTHFGYVSVSRSA